MRNIHTHSMKNGLRLSLLIVAIFLTYSANAKAPSYVTGIEAEIKDNEVVVKWDEQPNEDVAFYRVYYSFESILENEGLYDDFEETEGLVNEYTFENVPEGDVLYIAVMAVGTDGEEINLFVEEASVDLTLLEESEVEEEVVEEEIPEEPSTIEETVDREGSGDVLEVQDETLVLPGEDEEVPVEAADASGSVVTAVGIISIEAISPTEVVVILSAPITVEPQRAPEAFRIVDAFGQILPIVQMDIVDKTLMVKTVEQNSDHVYEFRMSEPAQSVDGLPFDPEHRRSFFQGHPQGKKTELEQPEELAIADFTLDAYTQPNGLFTVIGKWTLKGNRMNLKQYEVYQTRDGGQTMGQMEIITSDISGVQLVGVTPGQFGISIVPVDTSGTKLAGVFKSIPIGGSLEPQAVVVANLTAPQTPSPAGGNLPDSGIGIAFAISVAGGITGWRRMRKVVA